MKSVQQADRRVRRTKQRLHEALMSLILEKPYAKITVRDLIDRADVGRSTFYAHYETKDDLLMTSAVSRVIADFEAGIADDPPGADAILPSLGVFRHFGENKEQITALLRSPGVDLVRKAVLTALTDAAKTSIDKRVDAGEASHIAPDVRAAFVAGSLLALLNWWLDTNTPHSPETMADMFAELTRSA